MKLWRLDYHDDDSPSGSVSEYFATKKEAWARARELDSQVDDIQGYFRDDPKRVEVPTKKRDLLVWLDIHAKSR